jgi:hypothetical protein
MEGPTAAQMKSMLSFGKRMKPAAMLHVSLQARMEDRMADRAVRQDLSEAGFNADMIRANVRKLHSLVESLQWDPPTEGWSDYHACTHVGRDRATKGEFLEGIVQRSNPTRVLDIGANDGYFTKIGASGGALAIAVDGDEAVLDHLYRQAPGANVAIVVNELSNPSPSQGWASSERPSLVERADPDLVVAYGLIHHLIYTASVPPRVVMEWLRSFDCAVAVEFVSPEDEMVLKLAGNKLDVELHHGRDEATFREIVGGMFEVRSELALESGTRVLFELAPS